MNQKLGITSGARVCSLFCSLFWSLVCATASGALAAADEPARQLLAAGRFSPGVYGFGDGLVARGRYGSWKLSRSGNDVRAFLTTSALDRAGAVLMACARPDGDGQVACAAGVGAAFARQACDSTAAANGPRAVEAEYFARVALFGRNFHPLYRKMARLAAIARAQGAFVDRAVSFEAKALRRLPKARLAALPAAWPGARLASIDASVAALGVSSADPEIQDAFEASPSGERTWAVASVDGRWARYDPALGRVSPWRAIPGCGDGGGFRKWIVFDVGRKPFFGARVGDCVLELDVLTGRWGDPILWSEALAQRGERTR